MANLFVVIRFNFTRLVCWVLMVTISGCTSIQTYGLHQINSELPIEVGDKIKIFLHDSSFSDLHIIVTEINEKSIRGKRVSGTKLEVTVPRNEIGRIEARQPDSSKTTLLVLIGIAILAAAKNLGDSLDDLFDGFESD